MAQAYGQRDTKRLAALLPQVRGTSLLEPWAAYWELSARLGHGQCHRNPGFPDPLQRHLPRRPPAQRVAAAAGRSAQDWTGLHRELPTYRMNDDKSIQCYAAARHLRLQRDATPAALAAQVTGTSLAQPARAGRRLRRRSRHNCMADHGHAAPCRPGVRARLGMENDRLRIAHAGGRFARPSAGPRPVHRCTKARPSTCWTSSPPCGRRPANWCRWR